MEPSPAPKGHAPRLRDECPCPPRVAESGISHFVTTDIIVPPGPIPQGLGRTPKLPPDGAVHGLHRMGSNAFRFPGLRLMVPFR